MLRDYEIPLLEEMLQEDKYKNNIPLATSFVKDFLEEYKKAKKLSTSKIMIDKNKEQAINKTCEQLEQFDARLVEYHIGDSLEVMTKEEWKEWCKEDDE